VPDRLMGVPEARQTEYRALSERIAHYNRRVVAFSQYLMRDDLPRASASRLERYGGFESGLRHSTGRAKKAYAGFRLPVVALRKSRRTVALWGLVRPGHGKRRVMIEYRGRRGGWHRLKRDSTGRRGAWTTRTRYHRGRKYRVRWVSTDGRRYVSAPSRVLRKP
jgi:hypothetical protein